MVLVVSLELNRGETEAGAMQSTTGDARKLEYDDCGAVPAVLGFRGD